MTTGPPPKMIVPARYMFAKRDRGRELEVCGICELVIVMAMKERRKMVRARRPVVMETPWLLGVLGCIRRADCAAGAAMDAAEGV